MIEKERSSIIPAVISVWCTQFKAPCDSCWCVLTYCNEEHGWHCEVKSRDAPTGTKTQILLLTLSCLPFALPNPQC